MLTSQHLEIIRRRGLSKHEAFPSSELLLVQRCFIQGSSDLCLVISFSGFSDTWVLIGFDLQLTVLPTRLVFE
jgi:hypothetical protein